MEFFCRHSIDTSNSTLTLLEAPKCSWKAYSSSLDIASLRRFIVATSAPAGSRHPLVGVPPLLGALLAVMPSLISDLSVTA